MNVSQNESLAKAGNGQKFRAPNELETGCLSAVKAYLRGYFMHRFLSNLYQDEIKIMQAANNGNVLAWFAVAHCAPLSQAEASGEAPTENGDVANVKGEQSADSGANAANAKEGSEQRDANGIEMHSPSSSDSEHCDQQQKKLPPPTATGTTPLPP